jgi:glycosyltransferase involved in cell wall biosynthesis
VLPRVTVLMPAYNAAPFVAEAANSILSGSFRDLELLAINDGSTDGTDSILKSLNDERVRLVNNPRNMGLISTLNHGLDIARGEFVARMDADDVSMPDRLARQVAFMDANPQVGVSGTGTITFGNGKEFSHPWPTKPDDIRMSLFAYNPLPHPAVIMRMSLLNKHGLRFSADAVHAEDLDLWIRCAENFPMANIPGVGLRYRVHADQVTNKHAAAQALTVATLRRKQLMRLVPAASEEQVELHLALMDVTRSVSHEELKAALPWFGELEAANSRVKHYNATTFRAFLAGRWLNASHRCSPANLDVWRIWRSSTLARVGIVPHLHLLFKKALHR